MTRSRYALALLVLGVAYFGAAKLGIELSVAQGLITPVWAPTGIAIAALFLGGTRLWPAVALAAFVANATSGAEIPVAAIIAAGNTLEAVVGSSLLRWAGVRPALDRVRDVFALILLAAVASPVVAATNGVTTLWIAGDVADSAYDSQWFLWWVGDAMGALIVAPLVLVWSTKPFDRFDRRRMGEGLVALSLLVALSCFVFLAGYWRYPHLLFPLLIWTTLRFGQVGAVTGSFVVTALAVAGAVDGSTPIGERSTTEVVEILEGLLGAVAVATLVLGAVLSERVGAEQRAASALESLNEAQKLAHVGSWIWDIPTNLVRWSDELYRIYGVEHGTNVTYESYLEHIHPDDRPFVRARVERAYADREPFSFEHRLIRADGSHRWTLSRGQVVSDPRGNPIRMVGTAQDITEQKRLDELRDSILSTVSHELRTPLTTILGFSITLHERGDELSEDIRAEMVDHLSTQARKLDRLLADLLDLDRLRLGHMLPSFRETDVAQIARHVAGTFEPDRPITVTGGSVIAEVDGPKVERIIENLVANAIRHTPAGSEIDVSVARSDGGVLIAVDDRGPGVPEEDREAIFDPFTRGASAVAERPGTGIGLSLVAQFAELHGGRAWVEENPGGGASFRVFLPKR